MNMNRVLLCYAWTLVFAWVVIYIVTHQFEPMWVMFGVLITILVAWLAGLVVLTNEKIKLRRR